MAIILVPNVTLLPQDKSNGCWYFSAKMMSKWSVDNKKTKIIDPETATGPPPLDNLQQIYEWNSAWDIGTCKTIAFRLGMKALPREQRGFKEFKTLIANGPIWAAGAKGGATGSFHVVVIAGVADTGLYLFDPLPLNAGRKVWRTWEWMDEYFALTNAGFDANLLVPQ